MNRNFVVNIFREAESIFDCFKKFGPLSNFLQAKLGKFAKTVISRIVQTIFLRILKKRETKKLKLAWKNISPEICIPRDSRISVELFGQNFDFWGSFLDC